MSSGWWLDRDSPVSLFYIPIQLRVNHFTGYVDSPGRTMVDLMLIRWFSIPYPHLYRYFGDRMINYDLDEGYMVEDYSKYYNSSNSNYNTNLVISILIVESVNKKHAGNYSCSPSNAKPTQVTVHVLHGTYDNNIIIKHTVEQFTRASENALGGVENINYLPLIHVVVTGEKPAAMQHANRGQTVKLNFTLLSGISLVVIGVLGGALS